MAKKIQRAGKNEFRLFKQARSPYYYVEIMHNQQRGKFSTGATTQQAAKAKARAIDADIRSKGWDEARKLHQKKRKSVPNDPSISEFIEIYKDAIQGLENPPRTITVNRYIRDFERLCRDLNINKLSQLTGEKIERFKERYLKEGRAAGRAEKSVKTSRTTTLRSAAALFSKSALDQYRRQGICIENPFEGRINAVKKDSHYSPVSKGLLDKIWIESEKLRVGYSEEDDVPDEIFRNAQPEAYLIFIMELGLGMRRMEADRAEWNWLRSIGDDKYRMLIEETDCFTPKSGTGREIPIGKDLYETFESLKGNSPFIIPCPNDEGVDRARLKKRDYYYYRADIHHRTLVKWLRWLGVDDPKPCHRLRKEFGSYVATTHGIFTAQRYLGHSNPTITAKIYAGLTEHKELENFNPHLRSDNQN